MDELKKELFALLIFSALAVGIFLKLHEISILLQDKKPIIKKNSGKNG